MTPIIFNKNILLFIYIIMSCFIGVFILFITIIKLIIINLLLKKLLFFIVIIVIIIIYYRPTIPYIIQETNCFCCERFLSTSTNQSVNR